MTEHKQNDLMKFQLSAHAWLILASDSFVLELKPFID